MLLIDSRFGRLHLAGRKDLYSGEAACFAMGERVAREFVEQVLFLAYCSRTRPGLA